MTQFIFCPVIHKLHPSICPHPPFTPPSAAILHAIPDPFLLAKRKPIPISYDICVQFANHISYVLGYPGSIIFLVFPRKNPSTAPKTIPGSSPYCGVPAPKPPGSDGGRGYGGGRWTLGSVPQRDILITSLMVALCIVHTKPPITFPAACGTNTLQLENMRTAVHRTSHAVPDLAGSGKD